MGYITSAIGLGQQLRILRDLREQALRNNDDAEYRSLCKLIAALERAVHCLPRQLRPPTVH